MNTQANAIQSPPRDLSKSATRRIRVGRRSVTGLAAAQHHLPAPAAGSPDRPDAKRQAGGTGGGGILRRWSVADLIARAGGAPRAIA